jgi:hypothetical protein
MHNPVPMGAILNDLSIPLTGRIPEPVSMHKSHILYLKQPTLIQNYQLTNILAMWLSNTSAKAIFFGAS